LSETELKARYGIHLEEYIKKINIEALTTLEMAKRQILPACINYATDLAGSITTITGAVPGADVSAQTELLTNVSTLVGSLSKKIGALEKAVAEADSHNGDLFGHAKFYRDVVFPAMGDVRTDADKLEDIVDAAVWPIPTYADLLFYV
jgi:glutamine synthetase